MTRDDRHREEGFALVEAVAALLIVSLAFLMIATAAALLARSTERTSAAANASEVLIAGTSAWRREVLAAIDARALGTEENVHFLGGPHSIRFVAAPGGIDGPTEIVTIVAEGGRLLRESGALGAGAPIRPATVLLDGPWSYRFEFAGADTPQWQPSWQNAERLPKAVRLAVSGRNGRVALVAVRLMTETACPPEGASCGPQAMEVGDAPR